MVLCSPSKLQSPSGKISEHNTLCSSLQHAFFWVPDCLQGQLIHRSLEFGGHIRVGRNQKTSFKFCVSHLIALWIWVLVYSFVKWKLIGLLWKPSEIKCVQILWKTVNKPMTQDGGAPRPTSSYEPVPGFVHFSFILHSIEHNSWPNIIISDSFLSELITLTNKMNFFLYIALVNTDWLVVYDMTPNSLRVNQHESTSFSCRAFCSSNDSETAILPEVT